MKVLKATAAQYKKLNGYVNDCNVLEFTKDANNNWIVGLEVLDNGNFLEIREQLQALSQIDFNPLETTIKL